MNVVSRDPSGTLAGALAVQIDANGYAVIEDYVAPDELRGAQAFVADAIAANGGEFGGFAETERLGGTFLAGLPEDPDFVALAGASTRGRWASPRRRSGSTRSCAASQAAAPGRLRCASATIPRS